MNEKPDRWIELAELAASEQDPEKLKALIREMNQLWEQKHGLDSGGSSHGSADEAVS